MIRKDKQKSGRNFGSVATHFVQSATDIVDIDTVSMTFSCSSCVFTCQLLLSNTHVLRIWTACPKCKCKYSFYLLLRSWIKQRIYCSSFTNKRPRTWNSIWVYWWNFPVLVTHNWNGLYVKLDRLVWVSDETNSTWSILRMYTIVIKLAIGVMRETWWVAFTGNFNEHV